jgi:hypothetical protein
VSDHQPTRPGEARPQVPRLRGVITSPPLRIPFTPAHRVCYGGATTNGAGSSSSGHMVQEHLGTGHNGRERQEETSPPKQRRHVAGALLREAQ